MAWPLVYGVAFGLYRGLWSMAWLCPLVYGLAFGVWRGLWFMVWPVVYGVACGL